MTAYFCWVCKTKDHWADEACPKDAAPVVTSQVDAPTSTPVAAPIRKVQEFLRKVGRPKVYPDRKTQMRELMRRKRAGQR